MGSVTIPDTPAGRQASWLLEVFGFVRSGQGPERGDEHFAQAWHGTDEELARWWTDYARWVGDATVVSVDEVSAHEIDLRLDADGRPWRLGCIVEDAPPHRITAMRIRRTLDGMVVRAATETDAPALREVELQCPLVMRDHTVTFDRRDWLAPYRIVPDSALVVGEADGRIIGIYGAVIVPLRVGGVTRRHFLPRHLRMLPETQGTGVWRNLAGKASELFHTPYEGSVSFISPDNEASQRTHTNNPGKWKIRPRRALLDCTAHAGPETGRPASPADVERIVEIINTGHSDEECFVPYTVESFTARLERAPDLYSWPLVQVTDGAVMGVWPAGDTTTVIVDRDGRRSESRRALVVDHGFLPGAEAEFEALLRHWCAWAEARSLTHLAIFTSDRSLGADIVSSMAVGLDEFDMWTHNVPEPEGSAERGVYVDQLTF